MFMGSFAKLIPVSLLTYKISLFCTEDLVTSMAIKLDSEAPPEKKFLTY
jgi:hypothetical protein